MSGAHCISGDGYVVPFVESLEEVFDIVLTVLTQGGFFFFLRATISISEMKIFTKSIT